MRRAFALVLIFAAVGTIAQAARYRIIGGVVSDDSGAPIAGADVELKTWDANNNLLAPRHTSTDELGRYSFSAVEASGVGFDASKAGLRSRAVSMQTKTNKDGLLVIDITIHNLDWHP